MRRTVVDVDGMAILIVQRAFQLRQHEQIDAHVKDFGFAAGRHGNHVLQRMIRITERRLDAPVGKRDHVGVGVVP